MVGKVDRILTATVSTLLVALFALMLGCAAGLTNYLVDQEVPKAIFSLMNQYVSNKYVFLIILNILLLAVNMLEVFSAIIIIVPIIVPIAIGYGMNPVHLGIMFLLNLEIGYMVPPLALNIFLSSLRFNKTLPEVYRAVTPFLVLLLLLLLLVTYVPELSLFWVHPATYTKYSNLGFLRNLLISRSNRLYSDCTRRQNNMELMDDVDSIPERIGFVRSRGGDSPE